MSNAPRRPARRVLTFVPVPAAALTVLLLAGCAGINTPEIPEWMKGLNGTNRDVVLPNQVAGGSRNRTPLPGSTEARLAQQGLTPEQIAERKVLADALWARATQGGNTEAAGELYRDLADDYPESPHAAESMFRYGAIQYRQGQWSSAIEALVNYMTSIPVNPHLAEVEEMLYTSADRLLVPRSGIEKIFVSDDTALNTLDFVAQTFPAGAYADDALLRMARHYQTEEEWALAVLHYKEILIRYPDSEWSFRARLGLADSYLQRDQGDPYHAGFVDLDPRETYQNEQAQTFGADVKSSLRMALQQYEAFLERISIDPGRQAEYANEVAYARRMRTAVRGALAAKDLHVGNWYAARGDQQAAQTYYRYASAYPETPSGRQALAALGSRANPLTPPTPAPVTRPVTPAPSPIPRPVTVPTTTPAPRPPAPGPAARPPVNPGGRAVPPPPPPPNWPGVSR